MKKIKYWFKNIKKYFYDKFNWLTLLPKIKKSKKRTEVILPNAPIVLGIVVSLVITLALFWNNRSNSTTEVKMLEIIGEVIELPSETPQVALVSDASLLNQPFFEKAQNGDYVIVYQQAGKVLLYRPKTEKIVNFANIQIPVSETPLFQTQ